MSELHKAKELNERLDKEIRILRDRVRSMDNERVALLALVGTQWRKFSFYGCLLLMP